eukprot:TRINITY_DN10766_c0_g1_i1.p1 TRINITY_DN10766_c0_g1~~TRINITY_DN10766_c0_g1_i1.p1  ORF type:complete len:407 (+),score=65.08 TRINITY_DN10766_c0_g1_i1:58-1221(+)
MTPNSQVLGSSQQDTSSQNVSIPFPNVQTNSQIQQQSVNPNYQPQFWQQSQQQPGPSMDAQQNTQSMLAGQYAQNPGMNGQQQNLQDAYKQVNLQQQQTQNSQQYQQHQQQSPQNLSMLSIDQDRMTQLQQAQQSNLQGQGLQSFQFGSAQVGQQQDAMQGQQQLVQGHNKGDSQPIAYQQTPIQQQLLQNSAMVAIGQQGQLQSNTQQQQFTTPSNADANMIGGHPEQQSGLQQTPVQYQQQQQLVQQQVQNVPTTQPQQVANLLMQTYQNQLQNTPTPTATPVATQQSGTNVGAVTQTNTQNYLQHLQLGQQYQQYNMQQQQQASAQMQYQQQQLQQQPMVQQQLQQQQGGKDASQTKQQGVQQQIAWDGYQWIDVATGLPAQSG